MAYVNQEKKSKIVSELKKVMPANWKWSVSVENHSGIRLTISKGPKELCFSPRVNDFQDTRDLNPYYIETEFTSPELKATFKNIIAALNTDNHDNSDLMTDYFDVGHYIYISIGRWNKPFVITD